MGMIGAFVAVSPTELEVLKGEAQGLRKLFFDRLRNNRVAEGIDIDKSWAAIHFLLTGEPEGGIPPESLPVLGGTPIGPDLGYGPAQYLNPSEVKQASAVLESLSLSELKKRYMPSRLEEAGIYPAGIWEDEGDEAFEYIAHWYVELSAFYRVAADRGNAVLVAVI